MSYHVHQIKPPNYFIGRNDYVIEQIREELAVLEISRPLSTIQPTRELFCPYETRWGFAPWISLACHLVSEFIEFAHVHRVEPFARLFSKLRRDICQVEVVTIAFTQDIDLIEVTDPLCPDQRIYRADRNRQHTAIEALVVRFQEGVPDHVNFGLTLYFELFRNTLPVHGCRVDEDLGPGAAINMQLLILLAVALDSYGNRWKGDRNCGRSPKDVVDQFQLVRISACSDEPRYSKSRIYPHRD